VWTCVAVLYNNWVRDSGKKFRHALPTCLAVPNPIPGTRPTGRRDQYCLLVRVLLIPKNVVRPILIRDAYGKFRVADAAQADSLQRFRLNGRKITERVETNRGNLELRVFTERTSNSKWTSVSDSHRMMGRAGIFQGNIAGAWFHKHKKELLK
jgi:hypothetical protein